jgi:hypothetical protein
MEKIYQVSFNLKENDYKFFEQMAIEKNVAVADVIREALSYYKFMTQIVKDNGKILIEDKNYNLKKAQFV